MSLRKSAFVVCSGALIATAMAGCGLFRAVTTVPEKVASTVSGKEKPSHESDAAAVSARLMRFADIAATSVRQAADDTSAHASDREARSQALEWRIDYCGKFWNLATSPQPYQGLFDTIVLVSSARRAHEQRAGETAMAAAFTELERAAWELAGDCLTAEQVASAHKVIDAWLADRASIGSPHIAQVPKFDELMKKSEGGALSGLTELFTIDPLADLEPAVREVEQARQLSERAMYYLQRMPELLAARVELLTQNVLREPELATSVESFERVSRAADTLATTTQQLPARISTELAASREPVNEILGNAQRALEAGDALSKSLTETLRTFDALVARMQTDRPEPAATAPELPQPRPFDVLDYATAADKLTVLARELNTTVGTIDERMPALERALDGVAAQGERTIDHAFVRALELVLIGLAAGALTVLLVRRASSRSAHSSRGRTA